jgi:hypothetical protein
MNKQNIVEELSLIIRLIKDKDDSNKHIIDRCNNLMLLIEYEFGASEYYYQEILNHISDEN